MKRSRFALAVLTAVLACSVAPVAFAQSDAFTPVTDEMVLNPPPGDWLLWRRTINNQGYSPLDQINKENVGNLTLVWSRSLAPGNMEGTPLVHNGVMYMPQPAGVITAFDATTGDQIWEYRRQMPEDISELAISDITRAVSIYDDKILSLTSDGYVIALNAQTGALEWETQVSDYKTAPIWHSAGPTVINGKILSGRSCAPKAGPEGCFIAAHDVNTGEELWRTHLIPRPGEPGDDTWGNIPYEARWHVGSWGTPSYDPELNLAYFGTSVTAPSAKWVTGSDDQDREHLYQTSTLAVDIDTGEIKWYQQHIRDQWDLDHPFERILIDTPINPDSAEVNWIHEGSYTPGETRKVLTGIPGKTGIFYSIDRATGEFLWARNTILQNVVLDIDDNGRATMNSDLFFDSVEDVHEVCPYAGGGKDWPAGAYSPLTNALYYPMQNTCMTTQPEGDEPDVEGLYMVSLDPKLAPGVENMGRIEAVSVETGKTLWKYEQRAAVTSLVSTGGGLIFGGDVNRRFRAFDQETGDVLWETILGGPVGGFPITYEVGGKQYVAIATGNFLLSGGWLGLTPELTGAAQGNELFVFALND